MGQSRKNCKENGTHLSPELVEELRDQQRKLLCSYNIQPESGRGDDKRWGHSYLLMPTCKLLKQPVGIITDHI